MEKNMTIYDELQARGLLAQLTDEKEIKDLSDSDRAGFDNITRLYIDNIKDSFDMLFTGGK